MQSLCRHKLLPRKQRTVANEHVWLSPKLAVRDLPSLIQSKLLKLMSRLKFAEVTLCKMDKTATNKGHIAYGANTFDNRASEEYKVAV
jgi:hypothetical protein